MGWFSSCVPDRSNPDSGRLSTLTLGGLVIAIGEVVDDAIIDAENILRRLREAPGQLALRDIFRIVRDASVEVRSAVVYATFVVAPVFLPVLVMSGVQGRLFAPLAWSYILAILASLVVALTVTPAMCFALLPRVTDDAREPDFVKCLKAAYGRPARGAGPSHANDHRGGCHTLRRRDCNRALHGRPIPSRDARRAFHRAHEPAAWASLAESICVGCLVTRELRRNPNVRLVSQQIGRAELGDDTQGVHSSEIHIDLKPGSPEDPEQTEADLRAAVAAFPGPTVSINPFLAERIDEIIGGDTAQVVIDVYGEDLGLLDRKAAEIAHLVSGIRGAADVRVESPPGTPELAIRLKPERLRQFGFQPGVLLYEIQTAYQGADVGQIYDNQRVFGVDVILDRGSRLNASSIGNLLVRNSNETRLLLSQLAEIEPGSGRYDIPHEGTCRRQLVACNVAGRDLSSFVEDVKRTVYGDIKLPAGSYVAVGGASEVRAAAQREIIGYSLVAGTTAHVYDAARHSGGAGDDHRDAGWAGEGPAPRSFAGDDRYALSEAE